MKKSNFYTLKDILRRQGKKPKENFTDSNAPICKKFGCGKKLTPSEYLHSEYCFNHARQNNQR